MKKNIFRVLKASVAVFVVVVGWLLITTPSLPEGTDRIIDEVMASGPPELVRGETGTAASGDVTIWYERMRTVDPPRGTVLLIMGTASSALGWPTHFYQPLVDAGYEVIRFDHRDTGMSDWMDDWDADDPYDLEDLALDAIAVLDELQVDRAHIVGVSMGGMVGQRLAISHADRVATLTSISSSGYALDPAFETGIWSLVRDMIKLTVRHALIPSTRGQLKVGVGLIDHLRGDGELGIDVRRIVETDLYEATRRRGVNPSAGRQHSVAVQSSGSRYDELGQIDVPTLVVHGRADRLVPVGHAEAYAPMIPGSELLLIDGLGHLLPAGHMPPVVDAMLRLFSATDPSG